MSPQEENHPAAHPRVLRLVLISIGILLAGGLGAALGRAVSKARTAALSANTT